MEGNSVLCGCVTCYISYDDAELLSLASHVAVGSARGQLSDKI